MMFINPTQLNQTAWSAVSTHFYLKEGWFKPTHMPIHHFEFG